MQFRTNQCGIKLVKSGHTNSIFSSTFVSLDWESQVLTAKVERLLDDARFETSSTYMQEHVCEDSDVGRS